jgi:DNA mismatch endonuclease (patch repair protein)
MVFLRQRVVVFCDGDFWHGRHLKSRLARLSRGHNAPYWIEKIRTNAKRDRAITQRLRTEGWRVVRIWETDILRDNEEAVAKVTKALRAAGRSRGSSRTTQTVS